MSQTSINDLIDRLRSGGVGADDCAWILENLGAELQRLAKVTQRDNAIRRLGEALGRPTNTPLRAQPRLILAQFRVYERRRWIRERQARFAPPPIGADIPQMLLEIFALSDGCPPRSEKHLRRILVSD